MSKLKQRFISGAEIVSKRLWRPVELSDAFLHGGLGCRRPHSVDKEFSDKSCITCKFDGITDHDDPVGRCRFGPRGCGGPEECDFEVYLGRLMECDFELTDIEQYEAKHLSEDSSVNFDPRSKATHQLIIYALCKRLKIDPNKRGLAAEIEKELQLDGIERKQETIKKILSEIPDTLERNQK